MEDKLHKDGYVIISDSLNNESIQRALACVQNDNKVDYSIMKRFIDNDFLPTIQSNISFMKSPQYVKYRFSNNNNSTDASTFHKDVYNHTQLKLLPIYTCLCYFDDAQLEIIPGSHTPANKSGAISAYNSKQVINAKRGDIIVFHSNTYHRGIKFNQAGDRRLLQVFEVFPTKELYEQHVDKLITVKSHDSVVIKVAGGVLYSISKVPLIIDSINAVHFVLVYNDLQYKVALMDLPPDKKKNKYVTYESGKRKSMDKLTNREDLNMNIICDDTTNVVPTSRYYLYMCLMMILLVICLILVVKYIPFNLKLVGKNVRSFTGLKIRRLR